MPTTYAKVQGLIDQSGFKSDTKLRVQAADIIWNGIQLFRENKIRRYRSHKDKCKRSINRVPCVADSDVIGVGA